MRSLPMAVTADMTMSLIGEGARAIDVECSLEYRADEPYAIHATFRTGTADIEWVFARDLIIEGLQRPSGDGDIVISPATHGRIPLVVLALNSPSGEAELFCQRTHLDQFLRRTFDIVPVGSESDQVDIDAVIHAILGQGPTFPLPDAA